MLRRISYFITACKKLWFRIAVAFLYRDRQQRKQKLKEWTIKAEKGYLKRYLYVLNRTDVRTETETPKIIWLCWLQGEENAPEVVKKCIKSIREKCAGWKIEILTNDNLSEYADIPDYIYEKKQKGRITNTQFSDLLRIALLSRHGGIWIDATVFLTDSLPKEIMDSDFFAYHCRSYLKNNSWLLKANPENRLMVNMRNLMFEYWKHENRMLNYFLYHIFFDLMTETDSESKAVWERIPVIYDQDCYFLEYNFFTPYSAELWEEFKEKTSIHKLSYKYKKDKPLDGTFLEKFLKDELS